MTLQQFISNWRSKMTIDYQAHIENLIHAIQKTKNNKARSTLRTELRRIQKLATNQGEPKTFEIV